LVATPTPESVTQSTISEMSGCHEQRIDTKPSPVNWRISSFQRL